MYYVEKKDLCSQLVHVRVRPGLIVASLALLQSNPILKQIMPIFTLIYTVDVQMQRASQRIANYLFKLQSMDETFKWGSHLGMGWCTKVETNTPESEIWGGGIILVNRGGEVPLQERKSTNPVWWRWLSEDLDLPRGEQNNKYTKNAHIPWN